MEFKEFRNMISDHFKTMTKDAEWLFEVTRRRYIMKHKG